MAALSRKVDVCTGHANFPPRNSIEGSPNVFVNGSPVNRVGDAWAIHCNSSPSCHDAVSSSGSGTVFINNAAACRIGDDISCGSSVAQGSPDVFVGD